MLGLRLTKKSQLLAAAFVSSCVALPASASHTASFDCAEAETYNQKVVCTNHHLAELDQRMATAYSVVRAQTDNNDHLAAEQRSWARLQREQCESIDCLTDAYNDRINALQRQAAHGHTHGPTHGLGHHDVHHHDGKHAQCRNKSRKKDHHSKGHHHGHAKGTTHATPVGY